MSAIEELESALHAATTAIDELRRVAATVEGMDVETWPSHGNAPLAIAAVLELQRIEIAKIRAELEQRNDAIGMSIARRVKVENKLIKAKEGLTRQECMALALELGTPEEVRS